MTQGTGSRKRLHPGDVFVMHFADQGYLMGRVIRTDANVGNDGKFLLIYVYDGLSEYDSMPPVDHFANANLMFAPQLINRLGWSRGYFRTIGNVSLEDQPALDQHCFHYPIPRKGQPDRFFDEYNNPVDGPTEHVGMHGVGNYRTVDDRISHTLGWARSKD